MKYVMEMSEAEYIATVHMVENIVKTMCDTALGMQRATVSVGVGTVVGSDISVVPDNDEPTASVSSDWLKPEVPPTAEQVGRGPVDDIRAPDEEPVEEARAVRMNGKMLAKGRTTFNDLVVLWLDGYKQEDAPQPDRAEAVRGIANGRNSYKVLAYVKAVGGLTHAVNAALEAWEGPEEERQVLVLDVAGNITQVSSILFPDLSDLYEYKNIFQREENDHE